MITFTLRTDPKNHRCSAWITVQWTDYPGPPKPKLHPNVKRRPQLLEVANVERCAEVDIAQCAWRRSNRLAMGGLVGRFVGEPPGEQPRVFGRSRWKW